MSNVVLSVENLYKQYRLGTVGTGTMRDDLARFWAKLRGKEDPNLKIGEVNDREAITGEYVWALQDINFEVKQGEVLGIIGKNGAGKSTLLKILSKVTSPTKGQIKTKGRIASLLEVGTGFHPELTGRENIFLNGAILGMTKNDIRSKFDEIVDFSGIGKYIDTPVKRYSSGMYVRLAFAVAAHLEPEILIIDEVLAVGDAEFQKKCLGKMKDVSGEGRTVLFVSHQMSAINNLCSSAMYMQHGNVKLIGETHKIVSKYLETNAQANAEKIWKNIENAPGNDKVKLTSARIIADNITTDSIGITKDFLIEFSFLVLEDNLELVSSVHLLDDKETFVFASVNWKNASLNEDEWGGKMHKKGSYKSTCKIPANLLNEGRYLVNIVLHNTSASEHHINLSQVLVFDIVDDSLMRQSYFGQWGGVVRPMLERHTTFLKELA